MRPTQSTSLHQVAHQVEGLMCPHVQPCLVGVDHRLRMCVLRPGIMLRSGSGGRSRPSAGFAVHLSTITSVAGVRLLIVTPFCSHAPMSNPWRRAFIRRETRRLDNDNSAQRAVRLEWPRTYTSSCAGDGVHAARKKTAMMSAMACGLRQYVPPAVCRRAVGNPNQFVPTIILMRIPHQRCSRKFDTIDLQSYRGAHL